MGEEEGEERCLNWAGAHLYCALAEVTTYQSKQPISQFLLGECGIFSPCCIASRKRRKKKGVGHVLVCTSCHRACCLQPNILIWQFLLVPLLPTISKMVPITQYRICPYLVL